MRKENDMEAVPWLRSGTGSKPSEGGCILQIVDWIDRRGWTDSPKCVHPVLRRLAIAANDAMADDERQKLLGLTPRLMGTNTGGKELSVRLAIFCARKVLPIDEARTPGDERPRKAIEAAEAWVECPCEKHRKAAYAAAAYADDAAAYAAADAAAAAAADAYADAYADAAAYAAADAAADAYADDAAAPRYDFLLEVLDEYDRITGRTNVAPIPPGTYQEVTEVMAGR